MVAQRLYEGGRITYMRTDSVNLSSLCSNASKDEIIKEYGKEYSKPRAYHTNSKGAQEAHEAIRPTYMSETSIDGTSQEKRLYDLIWKRTIASQMEDAQLEKTTINISIDNTSEKFVANGEVVVFDGFLKVYRESTDEDENVEDSTHLLPAMKKGDELQRREIIATEKFSLAPARYTEASLVKKLEDLGIGRPSTYAPTISTIQQREYVVKGDKQGEERTYTVDTLKGIMITQKTKKEQAGSEKGKLLPTDIGIVVNDFLMANFPNIMDYNFTANVEQKFDDIAEGKTEWTKWMKDFDKRFEPEVKGVMEARSEHKAGERELGKDPKSGRPVFVKIGRFGPVVQIGTAEDKDKPQFAQLPADKSIETITLEEALELFKLPRQVGEFEGTTVTIGSGRFGPYVLHDRKYVSIPKEIDPMAITLEQAVELINEKRSNEQKRHITAVPFRDVSKNPIAYTGIGRSKKLRVWLPVTSYLIEHPKGNILIDTGWHTDVRSKPIKHLSPLLYIASKPKLPNGKAVNEQLEKLNIQTKDLDYVFLTHMDCDHASGLELVKDAKRIMISKEELEAIIKGNVRYSKRFWSGINIEGFTMEYSEYGPFNRGYDVFGDGTVVLIDTKGHTEGNVVVMVKNNNKFILITGDCGYAKDSWENLRIPGPLVNKEDMITSLKWIRNMANKKECMGVFATHDLKVKEGIIVL